MEKVLRWADGYVCRNGKAVKQKAHREKERKRGCGHWRPVTVIDYEIICRKPDKAYSQTWAAATILRTDREGCVCVSLSSVLCHWISTSRKNKIHVILYIELSWDPAGWWSHRHQTETQQIFHFYSPSLMVLIFVYNWFLPRNWTFFCTDFTYSVLFFRCSFAYSLTFFYFSGVYTLILNLYLKAKFDYKKFCCLESSVQNANFKNKKLLYTSVYISSVYIWILYQGGGNALCVHGCSAQPLNSVSFCIHSSLTLYMCDIRN